MNEIKFSVIIPTYNRASLLKFSLESVLKQDLTEIEVLVLDNCSSDGTQALMKDIRDPRVVYVRNKKNLGYAGNLKKGFAIARGKYVFLLSDDDLIARADTLGEVFTTMEKNKAGYAQLNLFYFEESPQQPTSTHFVATTNLIFKPTPQTLVKTVGWHFGFISGNIFKRSLINVEDLVDDIWWVYFPVIYKIITTTPHLYFNNHLILAKISKHGLISNIDLTKNHNFYLDKLFAIIRQFEHNPQNLFLFEKFYLDSVIGTLPGIKFYSSNKNLRLVIKKVLSYSNHKGYHNLKHQLYFLMVFFTPKFILEVMRTLRLVVGKIKMKKFLENHKLNKYLQQTSYG